MKHIKLFEEISSSKYDIADIEDKLRQRFDSEEEFYEWCCNADNKSDIDILVDLDYSQKIGLQFIQMKLDLEKLLNSEVDLVSSNGMSKYIKPLVDVEKRLIYEK